MMLLFITWDVFFTHIGVWGFNPDYLTGLNLANLPIEEWLFFICIPYACLFTYEAMLFIIKRDILGSVARPLLSILAIALVAVAFLDIGWYTTVTFILTAAFLLYWIYIEKADYLGRFIVSYLICLIPFYLLNGVLTGSWIAEQVVWYDDTQNLGIRIGTIPIEDSVYMLLMLGSVTLFYERWKTKHQRPTYS